MQVPDKQIELLKRGDVESWNAWRFADLSMRPCLDGVDLSDLKLKDLALWRVHLRNCVLNGADLHKADMRESDFLDTSFVGVDLTGASCWQSRFRNCNLSDVVLDSANFEKYDFGDSIPSQSANQTRILYLLPRWYDKHQKPPPEPPEDSLAIALLGDCTVSAGYLPPSERPCAILARNLAEYGMTAFIYDLSRDGMSVKELLSRYDQDVLPVPRIDIAFIRYGITDRKEYGAERFIQLLEQLCQKLEKNFPGVRIVIETGIYVDYPKHYPFDRNAKLAPLYGESRRFADDRSYDLVDIYAELEKRTLAGDWDWRIRGLGIGRPSSLHDASQDHLHENDPDWFFNIHPNRRCIKLIAEMERDAVAEGREQK